MQGALGAGFIGNYSASASGQAAVIRIPVGQPGPPSIDGAFNAFGTASMARALGGAGDRGGPGYAVPGMLLTITGENLAPDFIDLGLNDPNALPAELGGVQVLFVGTPPEIFHVAPAPFIRGLSPPV